MSSTRPRPTTLAVVLVFAVALTWLVVQAARGGPAPGVSATGATATAATTTSTSTTAVVTPGSDDRGARRIIAGNGGEKYWTADHYASFDRIREGA